MHISEQQFHYQFSPLPTRGDSLQHISHLLCNSVKRPPCESAALRHQQFLRYINEAMYYKIWIFMSYFTCITSTAVKQFNFSSLSWQITLKASNPFCPSLCLNTAALLLEKSQLNYYWKRKTKCTLIYLVSMFRRVSVIMELMNAYNRRLGNLVIIRFIRSLTFFWVLILTFLFISIQSILFTVNRCDLFLNQCDRLISPHCLDLNMGCHSLQANMMWTRQKTHLENIFCAF